MNKAQLYAAMAERFDAGNVVTRAGLLDRVLGILMDLLPTFVGSKDEALEMVEKFWDEVVVPIDIPGLNDAIEKILESALKPLVMKLAGTILDSLDVD